MSILLSFDVRIKFWSTTAKEKKHLFANIKIVFRDIAMLESYDVAINELVNLDSFFYSDLLQESRLLVDIDGNQFCLNFFSEGRLSQGKYKIAPLNGPQPTEILMKAELTLKQLEEDTSFFLVPWIDEVSSEKLDALRDEEISKGINLLEIELERFDHPVVYSVKPITKKFRNTDVQPLKQSARVLLNELIQRRPFIWHLQSDQRSLLWHHRERLVQKPEALMMFLKCIDWIDEEEVLIVENMLRRWAPLGTTQIIELLAIRLPAEKSHKALIWNLIMKPGLRENSKEFLHFIPQLIQAFLDLVGVDEFYPDINSDQPANFFVAFLIDIVKDSLKYSTELFWNLRVASKSLQFKTSSGSINQFAKLQGMFLGALAQSGASIYSEYFYQQSELFGKLVVLLKDVKKMKVSREIKQSAIIDVLDEPSNGFMTFKPVPLPFDPKIKVSGILADRSVLFKSNALPLKLSFIALDEDSMDDVCVYQVIYKEGDDLRQDQLVLMIIDQISRLWKNNGLDLRLTNYRVLATSVTTGLVQFIPSAPLSNVLEENQGNLRAYLSSLRSLPSDDYDFLQIHPEIHENYLRSVAGYSVITYVLGVGDRHLENLLITRTGHLFHVDYTYVFGRDPKPFPPPMKLCKEMVEAMSATPVNFDPEHLPLEYQKFKRLCFTAFIILRQNARELISSVSLLSFTGTTDLGPVVTYSDLPNKADPQVKVSRAAAFIQDRLMLELGELEALERFNQLIDDSVNALFPQVMETIHKWAQYWRT